MKYIITTIILLCSLSVSAEEDCFNWTLKPRDGYGYGFVDGELNAVMQHWKVKRGGLGVDAKDCENHLDLYNSEGVFYCQQFIRYRNSEIEDCEYAEDSDGPGT